jgi:formylmethanofuran dehydrogenase subunit E
VNALERYLQAGEILHGHPCPPLAVGVRAGAIALDALGVSRAVQRELFAFVEMGGDHYAQGFGDGVQIVTGCTFGKDNIGRMPLGKFGLTLLDQRQRLAVRVSATPGLVDGLESTAWFRRCERSGAPWLEVGRDEVDPVAEYVLTAPAELLFAVSPRFPMGIEEAPPGFVTSRCEGCGEHALLTYLRERKGRRLCLRCDDRAAALESAARVGLAAALPTAARRG